MFKGIKNWPEEKKKFFALFSAIIITIIIAVVWYIIHPIFNNSDGVVSDTGTSSFDEITNSIQKIGDEFNKAKEVFSKFTGASTSTGSTTVTTATSSEEASTTNNI